MCEHVHDLKLQRLCHPLGALSLRRRQPSASAPPTRVARTPEEYLDRAPDWDARGRARAQNLSSVVLLPETAADAEGLLVAVEDAREEALRQRVGAGKLGSGRRSKSINGRHVALAQCSLGEFWL